jgi:hypothetical protein
VALCLIPAPAPAETGSARNYLTVEGRVVSREGDAMPEAWVFCTGSRRASTQADSIGEYTLEIPGATLEELEKVPLKIRIQARQKGWRFALANGSPELGLEMRVVVEDSGRKRLLVRSNDADVVEVVANSVVLEANPRAQLQAMFVGSPGAQYEAPPALLTVRDEITLVGGSGSIPELGSESAATADSAGRHRTAGGAMPTGVAATGADTTRSAEAGTPATGGVPVAGPTAAAVEEHPAQSGSPAAHAMPPVPAAAVPPAARASTAASLDTTLTSRVPGAVPPAGSTAERPPGESRPGKPTVYRPALGADEQRDSRKAKKERPKIVRPAEPSTAQESAPATASTASRAGPATGPLATAAPGTPAAPPGAPAGATATDLGRAGATEKLPAARGDTVRSLTPMDRAFKPVVQRNPPVLGVGTKPPVPPQQVTPAPPSAATTAQPVPPARTPTVIAPHGATGPRPVPSCDCTIRGTVEVQSDRPLDSRTEVVISIDDDPAIVASVELFMGSPRAFEIHGGPCGAHRLTLHTRSKQRFVLVSADPRVECNDHGTAQIRLVIEPVARWGITP